MERSLDRFFKICKDLFENPEKTSVENFAEYVSQELSAGHIAHLTDCLQAVTDEIGELSETDFATLDKLFELGFHLMIPNVLEAVLHDDVVCTPDAMDMLLSLFRLLNASCEKSTQGKTKLAPLVPALIHNFLLNDERGTPLRVEAVKLTNMIFEETVYDERNGLDTISLALKDLDSICREEDMEHQLASAGDFELQAGLVELIFHLIPEMVRQDKAHVYFSDSSVARAFMDIKSSEFEAGCRYFLNTLNQNLKEKQSVASFPCYSATFGTAEVHPPIDPKITDFWVDFNLKSRSISLYVEERDNEGNSKDGNSLWELLLIKAEIVQDYRLTGAAPIVL
ncbi:synaptonemal complex protein 2-like [Acropora millepora]|uniref:synaptonemal complex protein 2-like n=1 Tax=Acropora millepora TaxID=45264 RepID=UPI001CF44541|nr:synaptonemal complex protein 2-like [Acropora millepora]